MFFGFVLFFIVWYCSLLVRVIMFFFCEFVFSYVWLCVFVIFCFFGYRASFSDVVFGFFARRATISLSDIFCVLMLFIFCMMLFCCVLSVLMVMFLLVLMFVIYVFWLCVFCLSVSFSGFCVLIVMMCGMLLDVDDVDVWDVCVWRCVCGDVFWDVWMCVLMCVVVNVVVVIVWCDVWDVWLIDCLW